MPKLSVTVITKNESANLGAALESVSWADEIVVVDSESTDDTLSIARRFTNRVTTRAWPGYVAQKNHAASLATHDSAVDSVVAALAALHPDEMSPRDALEALYALKTKAAVQGR